MTRNQIYFFIFKNKTVLNNKNQKTYKNFLLYRFDREVMHTFSNHGYET